MIIFIIVLTCLVLLLLMPCGISACYNSLGFAAKLKIGPFSVNLIRDSRGPHKAKKKKAKFESHAEVANNRKKQDFWPIVKLLLTFLSDFRKRLTVKNLQFKMILGGGDPYSISLNDGRYWSVLGNIIPLLESWFTIKKRNLEIECDYLASDTKVDAAIDLRLSVGTLLHVVLRHGVRILIKYYEITKQAKDGAVL